MLIYGGLIIEAKVDERNERKMFESDFIFILEKKAQKHI